MGIPQGIFGAGQQPGWKRRIGRGRELCTVVQQNRSEQTVCPGLVPATTFLAVDADGKLIGMIDIRHRLNEGLLRFGGNIGYSVRPCCRRQGYATQMLALALEECRKMQMQKVLVTCNKENIGSAKTIQKNGGVLENEVAGKENGEDRITQRYWITL